MRRCGLLPLAALLVALTACQAGSTGDAPLVLAQRPVASRDLADAVQPREVVSTDLRRVPVDWPWKGELDPRGLDCPNDHVVLSTGGFLAGTPAGYDTPERAVEAWLKHMGWVGSAYKVAPRDAAARILRADGTVRAQVGLLKSRVYIIHGSVACIEPQ